MRFVYYNILGKVVMSLAVEKCTLIMVVSLVVLGMVPGQILADPGAPTVETYCATHVSATSVALTGNLINLAGLSTVDVSFEWETDSGAPYAHETNGRTVESTGVFDITLRALQPQTTYYSRAKAENTDGTAYGAEKGFTTPSMSVSGLVASKSLLLTDATLSRLVYDATNSTLTGLGIDLASGIAGMVSGAFAFSSDFAQGIAPRTGAYLAAIVSDLLMFIGTRVPFAP